MRIFYVTDIHGSEICWRKFLNAGPFYGADVVIVGGDVTGKAMVPIVERGGHWEATFQDHHEVLETETEVRAIEPKIQNRGYYPIRVSDEEYRHMQEDEDAVDKRFKRGHDGGDRALDRDGRRQARRARCIRVIVCPANDDMFEIDPILQSGHVVEMGGEEHPIDLEGFTMVSHGLDEPDAVGHVPRAARGAARRAARRPSSSTSPTPSTTIFNFHAPPYGSGLDEAPALDDDMNIKAGGQAMRPVGSTSVRAAIERVQPVLSTARPHPREQGGDADRARRWC